MVEIKMDAETLRLFNLFEKVTRSRAKDVVEEEDRVTFLVDDKQLGKAIGKGATNLKRLRDILDKQVDLVGFHEDVETFVKNVFHKHKLEAVHINESSDEGVVIIVTVDPKDKGKAIGKGGRNVDLARTLLKRHHDVKELKLE